MWQIKQTASRLEGHTQINSDAWVQFSYHDNHLKVSLKPPHPTEFLTWVVCPPATDDAFLLAVFSVLLFCLWDRVIFEQCCQPFSTSSSYSFSCIIVTLVLLGQEYLTGNVRKEWYIFTHGSRLQLVMVRKSWWQGQEVSNHIPSVSSYQRAVHGVLSSLSTFYVFQDLKPWHDSTHNQGGSPYFE